MRGYPKHIITKQDFLNLLSMPEFKEQAMKDLAVIRDLQDDKARIATTQIDAKDPESDWNTKEIDNPMPAWKSKGFASRQEVADLITTKR